MPNDVAALKTIPEVAKLLHVRPHQIHYALEAFASPPTGRIGNARVFDAAGVLAIKAALRRVASRNQMHPSPANTMLG